jgi:predicted metal-dependent peptidase
MDESVVKASKSRLDRCMFSMFRDFPFWAFLIEKCNVKLTDDESIPTAAVNKHGDIFFNTSFMASLSEDMLQFVLSHEVMHLLLDHHSRRAARDPLLWNIAGDVLINTMLQDHFRHQNKYLDLSNFCTSDSVGIDCPDDKTTEQVYDEVASQAAKLEKLIKEFIENSKNGTGPGLDLDGPEGEPSAGSVTIRDKSETTPTSEKEWAEAGLEAATRSRMAGNCPGFMARKIDAMLNPEVPWQEVLAYLLRQKFCMNSRNRHTFTPPNRRYLHQDVIMTSRVGSKKPSIAFCVDTSGSMSLDDLAKGVAEMNAIRKLYKVPVYLIEADMTVTGAKWIDPSAEIPELKGGGGTSFVPAMNHLKEVKPDIDALVYFTDGYGDFGTDPGFDVIWVLTSEVEPPYGKKIRVRGGV